MQTSSQKSPGTDSRYNRFGSLDVEQGNDSDCQSQDDTMPVSSPHDDTLMVPLTHVVENDTEDGVEFKPSQSTVRKQRYQESQTLRKRNDESHHKNGDFDRRDKDTFHTQKGNRYDRNRNGDKRSSNRNGVKAQRSRHLPYQETYEGFVIDFDAQNRENPGLGLHKIYIATCNDPNGVMTPREISLFNSLLGFCSGRGRRVEYSPETKGENKAKLHRYEYASDDNSPVQRVPASTPVRLLLHDTEDEPVYIKVLFNPKFVTHKNSIEVVHEIIRFFRQNEESIIRDFGPRDEESHDDVPCYNEQYNDEPCDEDPYDD